MRCQLTAFLLLTASPALAQTRADSALVARILTAEDRRDSASAAFSEGLASRNPTIRVLAARAVARIKDPRFASRDSLPPLPPPPNYPDPAWRLRYRALATKPIDCERIDVAMTDSAWPVRLRAVDLATPNCEGAIIALANAWLRKYPSTGHRTHGGVAWQAAAHAFVAAARLSPENAKAALPALAKDPVPWTRVYAARGAAILEDTATLKQLTADPNDNVKEAAIDGLAKVAGHAADDVYIRALDASGYQVIRAAAIALKGTPRRADIVAAGGRVLAKLRADSSETSRDARVAIADRLRELGVANVSADLVKQPSPVPLSRDAVALALGKDVRLRVTIADSSGGGSFVVRLRGDVAPIMAARVLSLVRAGWYDNRTWYRVEPDFVIQGGGPGSNEYVGHPRFMRDELAGVQHLRGTVGMSTRGHDTGDAQWFINLRDNQRLTRDYTLFGEVVEGIDVVDGILEGDVIARIEVLK